MLLLFKAVRHLSIEIVVTAAQRKTAIDIVTAPLTGKYFQWSKRVNLKVGSTECTRTMTR